MKREQILRILFTLCLSLLAGFGDNTKAQKAELVVQMGHSDIVYSVSFSSDGKILATISEKTIKLWDVESGKELRTLNSGAGKISFSSDGRRLASSSSSTNTIKTWDVKSGKELKTLDGSSYYIQSISFTSDGRTLAVQGRDNTIRLLDVESGKELRTLNSGTVYYLSFSADGKTLAGGGGGKTIKLWDVESGKEVRTLDSGSVYALTLSADGKTLACSSQTIVESGNSPAIHTIKIWDVENAKELRTLTGHSFDIHSLSFSSDGKTLATGSRDMTIKLWDVGTGKELRTLRGHSDWVNSVSFSSDGKTLASGSGDHTIKLWDVESGNETRTLAGRSSGVSSVSFSSDGKTLASGSSDKTIKLWDLKSGSEMRILKGHSADVSSTSFSSDGRTLASGSRDKTIQLWDIESGKAFRTLKANSGVNSVSLSSDGRILAIGSDDHTILWDETGNKVLRILKGHSAVWSLSFSSDGRTLASGNHDNTIKLWDVESGKQLRTLTGHSTSSSEVPLVFGLSVSFGSGDKILASGSYDTTVKLWDVESGKELRTFKGHSSWVSSVSFSSNGKTLASGSYDTTVKLWDVENGKELRTLKGHSDYVRSVSFVSDRILATGSADGKTKLWDVATGNEICSLIAVGGSDWLVIDPKGRFDTNKIEDAQGLHWVASDDPMTPLPLEIFMRDYYEPQLLPRLLKCNEEKNCDQEFKPARGISEINRVQPPVEIKNVSTPDAEGYVNVTVEVGRGKGKFVHEGKEIIRTTDIYDLHLFRDGQMVAYWPSDGARKLVDQTTKDLKAVSRLSDETKVVKEWRDWQRATRVELDANGRKTVTARVRLPKGKDAWQTEFTAYGFNEDRVKSLTGKWTWPADVIAKLPKARAIKPRAYVITIGVNASQNPDWRLQYAVNDALKMRDTLSAKLKELRTDDPFSDRYDVVAFPLVSDYTTTGHKLKKNDATKQKIKAVLDLLAGREVDDKLLAELQASAPQVGQLRKAEPDDLLVISFSSHGYTDRSGNFFILPYDIGSSSKITPDLLAHCISSEELSLWLRDVDAGEMVMIIDACHAAAVTGKGFKPGPMASRGLGQLAYDKGMRILTATQANDFALESGSLDQGLLSYALVEDGLKEGRADFKPTPDGRITMKEWLEYGAAQVPSLYDKIKRGELKAVGTGARAVIAGARKRGESYQQRPSLFDFARKRADITISVK